MQSPQSSVEILNYSPHSSGGYAVSRSFAAKTEKVDNSKHLAREFLMEQIRNGWPYAERFYRTYGNLFSQKNYNQKVKFLNFLFYQIFYSISNVF